MAGELVPISLFVSFAVVVVGLTKIISDNRTRRQLIQAGATPEMAAAIATAMHRDPNLYGSLKWGLVIGAVGVALIILEFLPYTEEDPITFGLVLVFAAAGLLGYYAAARRLNAA